MAAKAAIHDTPRQTRFWVRLGVCWCTSRHGRLRGHDETFDYIAPVVGNW